MQGGVSFTARPIYRQGRTPAGHWRGRSVGPSRVTTLQRKEYTRILPLPESKPRILGRPAQSLDTKRTELPRQWDVRQKQIRTSNAYSALDSGVISALVILLESKLEEGRKQLSNGEVHEVNCAATVSVRSNEWDWDGRIYAARFE